MPQCVELFAALHCTVPCQYARLLFPIAYEKHQPPSRPPSSRPFPPFYSLSMPSFLSLSMSSLISLSLSHHPTHTSLTSSLPFLTQTMPSSQVLSGFTAPFDKNGVLYHIGTSGGTEPYQNPHLTGAVTASMSSIYKVHTTHCALALLFLLLL